MLRLFEKLLPVSALLAYFLFPATPVSATTPPFQLTVSGNLDGFGRTPIVGVQNEHVDVAVILSPVDFRLELFPAVGTSDARAYLMPLRDISITVVGSQSGRMVQSLIVSDIILRQLGNTRIYDEMQFRNYIPFATGTTLLWREPANSNFAARTGLLPSTVIQFFAQFEKTLTDGVNWRAATTPQFAATNGVRTGTVGIRNATWTITEIPEPANSALGLGIIALVFLRTRSAPQKRRPARPAMSS
jgi:hypothetical protein